MSDLHDKTNEIILDLNNSIKALKISVASLERAAHGMKQYNIQRRRNEMRVVDAKASTVPEQENPRGGKG